MNGWRTASVTLNRLLGGNKVMFCARVHENSLHCGFWKTLEIIIDLIFLPFGKNHCQETFRKEVTYAKRNTRHL